SRVVELNRCYPKGYFSVQGPYSDFLARREEFLAGQAQLQNVLANKVRREIEWLKRGPKARTTKSVSRIKQADQLMGELADVSRPKSARGGLGQAVFVSAPAARSTRWQLVGGRAGAYSHCPLDAPGGRRAVVGRADQRLGYRLVGSSRGELAGVQRRAGAGDA